MRRYGYWIRALSCGAVMLGILQALGGLNFATIWTDFLSRFLAMLIALLLGANPSQVLA